MIIPVRLHKHSYPIRIERGALQKAGECFRLDRKVLILTDEGVPPEYAEAVAKQCGEPHILTVPQGEGSKSFPVLETVLEKMLDSGFNRGDCVVSVGGGVITDLGGFAASVYMRGIDCYGVPTTVLADVDASVGGKTAVNFRGVKNIVGAFYQPKAVLIDPETLKTLPKRQVRNGLAEALKMAVTLDGELFGQFEKGSPDPDLEEIIIRSVLLKRNIVEQDEKESDLRRVLNFGHTIGHGIESAAKGELLHGESVALGMIPMCSEPLRSRLKAILDRMGFQTEIDLDPEEVYAAVIHDKKSRFDGIGVVRCDSPGSFTIGTVAYEELKPLIGTVVRRRTI